MSRRVRIDGRFLQVSRVVSECSSRKNWSGQGTPSGSGGQAGMAGARYVIGGWTPKQERPVGPAGVRAGGGGSLDSLEELDCE